ncbi:MAG: hypothetical protein BWZ10_01113 [candidate division BRC1 bacterium ADurb.BinA364]|nr:MAG: hypothetical protein BWZ10_01113 [candidate division BRC1 bacterium ADurb.BinA364]
MHIAPMSRAAFWTAWTLLFLGCGKPPTVEETRRQNEWENVALLSGQIQISMQALSIQQSEIRKQQERLRHQFETLQSRQLAILKETLALREQAQALRDSSEAASASANSLPETLQALNGAIESSSAAFASIERDLAGLQSQLARISGGESKKIAIKAGDMKVKSAEAIATDAQDFGERAAALASAEPEADQDSPAAESAPAIEAIGMPDERESASEAAPSALRKALGILGGSLLIVFVFVFVFWMASLVAGGEQNLAEDPEVLETASRNDPFAAQARSSAERQPAGETEGSLDAGKPPTAADSTTEQREPPLEERTEIGSLRFHAGAKTRRQAEIGDSDEQSGL